MAKSTDYVEDEPATNLPTGVRGRKEAKGEARYAGLSDERLADLVSTLSLDLSDARDFIDNEIGELRAQATEYYNGEPFGNEEDGRSSVVSRDVRDTVQAIMPSLLRIFFGGENVVEYEPRRAEDVEGAEQATDYINAVVVQQDNQGFLQFHSAFKDALVRKTGVWKWWWDKRIVLVATEHEGLSDEDLMAMDADEFVEKVEAELESDEGVMPKVWKATVHRRIDKGRARFAALPGEEFLIDRRATSIEDATLVAHRRMVRVTDLVAMGYDRDEILEHAGIGSEMDTNVEYNSRMPYAAEWGHDGHSEDTRRVLYTESYTRFRLSEKESDPAQLVKVCGIGLEPIHVLEITPVDEVPFASICPDPEPHAFFGLSIADLVMDIQLIKSAILRGTLDSLTQSLFPRTEVVDGQVNMDDLLNNELGGIVRVEAPGMMREVKASFVGADSLPMLEYFDQIRDERTKQSRASQGLDADALQSTTKAAVSATVSAAQAQIELIARIFAETGVKALFGGLLRLITRHQDRPRTVRLRGKWVEIDPKSWDAEMSVKINVAIGAGTADEKLGTLMAVKETQEGILQLLGPENPIVSMANYRHTLAKILELSGWKNADAFFKPVAESTGEGAAAAGQGAEQDAAAKLAEAQMADIQAKIEMKKMELEFEREKLANEDARERYKIQVEAQTKIAIAEATTQADINNAAVNAEVEAMKAAQDGQARRAEAEIDAQARQQEAQMAAEAQVAAVEAQPVPTGGQ
jgi:hypothetical protein